MAHKIDALLVEDDPDFVHLISLHLNEACGSDMRFVLECAESLEAAMACLGERRFDVVILDLNLHDSQGFATLDSVREKAPGVPVVVLTGWGGEETGLEAIMRGAQDYLTKDRLDPRLLRRAVAYARERARIFAQMERVISNSADAMVVVDDQGRVAFANPTACELLGWKPGEAAGRPFGFPLQPNTSSELRLPQEGRPDRIAEMRVTSLEWHGSPARLASIRDITALRSLEQVKAEIKERRRVDKLKDQILSTVSHELRSPLTVIKAAVANMRDGLAGSLSREQVQMVGLASKNAERLAHLINNLLDLSRLESGKARIARAPFDLRRAVEETVEGIRLADPLARVSLVCELPDRLPPAFADADAATQVLTNLIDNAMRFARSRVVVRARTAAAGEPGLEVEVADDGAGIPPERVPELFDRFTQLERPVGGAGYKGTGLGLAICRELIRANEGRIWCESQPGQGAAFHFVVPSFSKPSVASEEARHAGGGYEEGADRR